jgi:DNA modification methylase
MTPNTIYEGDCIETMRAWPNACVQTCITSPPYYGLRDYGHDGQIGLEETPEAYVAKMVEVFREVRRVLADDGTLWLNLGDSYSSHKDCKSIGQTLAKGSTRETAHEMDKGKSRVRDSRMLKSQGLKNKDLIGIPWMVAFALRADGWYLRQDIIWHKPNPMPESVTDRCTKAHEYIFLLAKSQRYYYDHEAVKEDASQESGWLKQRQKGIDTWSYNDTDERNASAGARNSSTLYIDNGKRNRRSVWTVTTKPYIGAHFATFPADLIAPCIQAGAPEGGIVLDPFMGSGTTAHTALRLGRRYVGCELSNEYIKLANKRLQQPFLI